MAERGRYIDRRPPKQAPPARTMAVCGTTKVRRVDMCSRDLPDKMPEGGAYQVLGTFPTDKKVTPPIPDWLPAKLHPQWPEIWKHRPKQYVRPFWESKKRLPWDTTHSIMGDYNGPEEYYVEGCFGYDERGQEILKRPGLPGVHAWSWNRPKPGLAVILPIWYGEKMQNPPAMLFDFHTAGRKFSETELKDIGTIVIINKEKEPGSSEEPCKPEFDLAALPNRLRKAGNRATEQRFAAAAAAAAAASGAAVSQVSSFTQAHLLALPGEVRNQIYGYLFEDTSAFHITWCSRGRDLTHYTHKTPSDAFEEDLHFLRRTGRGSSMFEPPLLQDTKATTLRRRQMRSVYGRNNQAERPKDLQASGATAILMTCKQLHFEAAPLFYGRHAFSFHSRAILHKFMCNLSPAAMSSIRHVYLAYSPQGNPWKTKDAVLVQKERELWMADLKYLAFNFTHLQTLNLLLTIRDAHINNTDRADWAMALRRGLAGLKSHSHLVYFRLEVELGDESSLSSRLPEDASETQVQRCEDLANLVRLVKRRIWEYIEVDENREVIRAQMW